MDSTKLRMPRDGWMAAWRGRTPSRGWKYRPYLNLSPDEALTRLQTAAPEEKKLLELLAGAGWGPIQLYFRLSAQEQAALCAGQELRFSQEPKPGQSLLPPGYPRSGWMARGVLQAEADLSQIQPTRLEITLLYRWGTPQDKRAFQIHTTGPGDTGVGRWWDSTG